MGSFPDSGAEPSADEATIIAALRAATLDHPEAWDRVRFVDAARVERGGRLQVAGSATFEWSALEHQGGLVLRPYGVHHHTLIVGVADSDAGGVSIDTGRLVGRAW
jgi:hypothetical protein